MSKVKIAVLGKQGVGKSSLCLRYATGNFYQDYQSTIGAAFFVKKVTVQNKLYVLNIWDTAGSERFDTYTKMYLRGAAFCLICFESDSEVIENIKKYEELCLEEDVEIVLVATKQDMEHQPFLSEAKKYAEARGYQLFCTSSLNDNGIKELFAHIISRSSDLLEEPHIKLSFDESPDKKSKCCW